ncbi:MAG: hypothetical protein HRF45_04220 [Fimbriimonadia bacterium]|jgi:hypothetical protein
MMERINRFRRDPRMVAPLSLIAVLVVGYAVMQALAGPSPVRVRVQEVTPQVQTSVSIPMGTDSRQIETRNPYFHPALLQAENPKGGTTDEVPPGGLGGLLPVQPAPSEVIDRGMPPPLTAEASVGPGGHQQPKPQVVEGSEPTGVQGKPTPQAAEASEQLQLLPQYQLVAVVLGAQPAALLVTETGDNLQVMLSDKLPGGERVVRITSTYVALEGSGWARILFLSGSWP